MHDITSKSQEDPRIRPIREADIPAVLDIAATGWSGVSMYEMQQRRHGRLGPNEWWERKRDEMRADCQVTPERVIVAEVDGQVVGYACFSIDEERGVGSVSNNAVAVEHRGCGIGSRMHDRILDHFRSLGLRVAQVTTMEQDEPARRMYERHGFREIARSIHYTLEL